MHPDPFIEQIVDQLRIKHSCHTVILYGSRALGDARHSSDYDLLGIRAGGQKIRDARLWNGVYLDLLIYPESELVPAHESMLQWLGGQVLCQQGAIGDTLLARLEAIVRAGPPPLPADERQTRRVWAGKMLARAREGDIEAHYRRAWLLTALLEDYFQLRDQWYLGPKKSLLWLREHDPTAYTAFESALEPGASLDTIDTLIAHVLAT